jgi:D-galactosamine 6-phosphate deaminase/isomerase
MSTAFLPESEWLQVLAQRQKKAAALLRKSPEEQRQSGYFHTLREICQQPATWVQTCELMQRWTSSLRTRTKGIQSLILTGSGSSEYAGDCVRLSLQHDLGIGTQAVGSGIILANGSKSLLPSRPGLMVSVARSGDSPESVGSVSYVLKIEPDIHHLVLTCNAEGRLATTFSGDRRVTVITLDKSTNDQSLVMTSSFTNLALAARFLGLVDDARRYKNIAEKSARIAEQVLGEFFETIALAAQAPFKRAVFLGSGAGFSATREAALKMLEMTAGRVTTLCETYLGLRHGPMSYIHDDSLIVAFLSSDPTVRAYEADLLQELNQKELGLLKLIVGENIPPHLVRAGDVALECKGLTELGDENVAIIHVLVGQLLAFFRCLHEGLRPDSPSENGVINRVVQSFALHIPETK